MRELTVSVITPCHNAEVFVAETIDSVLAQSGVEVEHIVIDDASTDESWTIIRSYGGRLVGRRLERNRGAPHARNLGAEIASGDLLMFLDADDLLAADTLRPLAALLTDGASHVAACPWRQLKERGGQWVAVDPPFPSLSEQGDYLDAWLTGWYFPTCAVLWPRLLYDRMGGWDEGLPVGQDADLMMRALQSGVDITVATEGEAFYRIHPHLGTSVSRDVSEPVMRGWMRVYEKVAERSRANETFERHRESIGVAYYRLARNLRYDHPQLTVECLRRAERYAGTRALLSGSRTNRLAQRALGITRKERLAAGLERLGVVTPDRKRALRERQRMRESTAASNAD